MAGGSQPSAGGTVEVSQVPAKRRMKSPRFALAVPAGLLFILFFLVPVAFIAYYSFGYKPFFLTGLTIATDKLSFSNYGDALSGTFLETFKGTLQISILGTFICL